MAAAVDDILAEAFELSILDRLKLAEALLVSLESSDHFSPVERERLEVIRRRIAQIEGRESTAML